MTKKISVKSSDKEEKVSLKKVCGECNGAGLKNPQQVNSEVCPKCKGECVENINN